MKTGIITGVGNGIGYEITLNLLKKKFKIIGISNSKNKNVINLKQKYRNHFEFYQQDLSKKKDSNEKIKKILKKYKEINFLINNAGIRYRKSNLDSNFNTYQRVLDNNFFSAIIITNQYLKFLSEKNFSINSSIVNITLLSVQEDFQICQIMQYQKVLLKAILNHLQLNMEIKMLELIV